MIVATMAPQIGFCARSVGVLSHRLAVVEQQLQEDHPDKSLP